MKIAIILGTRPEIIKISPLIRELSSLEKEYLIIHTNQHYSENMDKIFFEELDLPPATFNLNIGSAPHGEQTGKMLIEIEKVLKSQNPAVVLVEGDTNTVLAGALAASKLGIQVGHIEAGLRSYDRSMPEETNRIVTDHISDYLFAPTENAKQILLRESIPRDKIFVTGNTIVDALHQNLEISQRKSNILSELDLQKNKYFLVTMHRQENVDNKERLKKILQGLSLVYEEFKLPLIYPIHPRTKKMVSEFGLKVSEHIKLIEPLGYLDFLQLLTNSRLVLTDSGGIQEETCILKIPCVTLRENTERPETIDAGGNLLAGYDPLKILDCTKLMISRQKNWENPFGDGKASKKILYLLYSKT
ncbi:MAG: UDP-N-acetylglucosamine 2-epimerase (non-hydrolyzing) [archaeon]